MSANYYYVIISLGEDIVNKKNTTIISAFQRSSVTS